MAPKSTFRQVYVDIPPSPYTSAHRQAQQQQPRQVEQAPKPKLRPVPVVEIPHSPLWKYTPQKATSQAGSQAQKPIAPLNMNSRASRSAPLKEKNVQPSNSDDRKPGKRKAKDLDEGNEAKKPRLETAVSALGTTLTTLLLTATIS